ncbi:uncharacterized protein CEXT_338121 [Caerostris extrusa]|uniref:Uncharacterized protein n=1 Tax=Caerostris extrusa TaxID=172846 RepID=A0AAV4YBX0_CAEEX|nr:uncharacterized protein CEXT_338121 [Caerostris extrusa]
MDKTTKVMKNEPEVPEAPEALCLCIAQGSIQAKIRPGVWIPLIRSLHVYEESWKISANPIVCSKDVLQAVTKLHRRSLKGTVFTIGYVEEKAECSRIEILVFTRCRNVYVIQLNFKVEESVCIAHGVVLFSPPSCIQLKNYGFIVPTPGMNITNL